jgi:hypothetical protein
VALAPPSVSIGRRLSVWKCHRCRPPSQGRSGPDRPGGAAPTRRETRCRAEFGDRQSEVTHLGGELPLSVAVAVAGSLLRAAVTLDSSRFRKPPANDLRNQGDSDVAFHELNQLGGVTIGRGSWSVIGLVVVLRTRLQNVQPWGPYESSAEGDEFVGTPPIATAEI